MSKNNDNNEFLYGSICLTDIPAEHIVKHTNGKKYLPIGINKRKEKGKYGETHNVTVNVSKENRKPDEKTTYIGNLKTWNANASTEGSKKPDDDLPF